MAGYFPGDLLAKINTQNKILAAIKDVYEIIRSQQPEFEPKWRGDEQPVKVLLYMLRKMGAMAKGEEWFIDCHGQNFSFVMVRNFPSYYVKNRDEFMPLDFLPALKPRDERLHDLIIDTIALVSKCNRIPLWDEDGHYSQAVKDLVDQEQTGYLQQQKNIYSKGIARQYLRLIKRRQKVATTKAHLRAVEDYPAVSGRQNSIKRWMKFGIRLADTGENILPFILRPGYREEKRVLYAHQMYKFVWSTHQSDVVHKRVGRMLRSYESSAPVLFSRTRPGEKIKPIKDSQIPPMIYNFMSYGVQHVMWTFREYYYKKIMEGKVTPTNTLLEKLSIDEFINHE